jgi:hypothetical protein
MPAYVPCTSTDSIGNRIYDQSNENKKSYWDFLFDKDFFDVTIFSTPGNGIQLWSSLIHYGFENSYLDNFDTLIIQQTSEPRWFFSNLLLIRKFYMFKEFPYYKASNINSKHYKLIRKDAKHVWQELIDKSYTFKDQIVQIPDIDYIISTFPHRIISDCKKYKKNLLFFNYNFVSDISYPDCYIPFNNEPIYFDLPNIASYLKNLKNLKKYMIDNGHATEEGMEKVADLLRQAGILNFLL